MSSRALLLGAAALLGVAMSASSAYALTEGEIIRLHEACVAGDHDACKRRDAVIHDHDHEGEWRHNHPEWYR